MAKKVVVETSTSTSSGNSIAAWVIIAVVAIALIAYIVVRMT